MKKFLLPGVFSLTVLSAITPAFSQAGRLDPSFGTGGIAQTNFGSNTFALTDAVLAPNGDIVVSGTLTLGSTGAVNTAVVRYLPSGALDSTFGSDGIVTLPAPTNLPGAQSIAFGVAVQSNEKIVVISDAFPTTGNGEEVLVRLNSNGQLDSTFGTGGQAVINVPVPSTYNAQVENVIIQPNGSIVVAGFDISFLRRNPPPELTVLARYLSTGAIDTSFGTAGFVQTVAIGNISALALSGSDILVGNFLGQIASFSSAGALLKVSPNASPVIDQSQPMIFLPSGDLLVGTTVSSPEGFKDSFDAVVERFAINGQDTSFESPLISLAPDAPFAGNGTTGLGFDSEGRIAVAVGFGHSEGRTGNDFFSVVRLNSNGSLDTTFGSGGFGTTLENSPAGGQVLVQPNNDIVVVGSATLVRYLGQ